MTINKMDEDCLIWDSEREPDVFGGSTILWKSYQENRNQNIFSICKTVEENSEELREYYLNFIEKIANFKEENKSVAESFQIRPDLSYIWFTLVLEKCNFSKSEYITDVIKVTALLKYFKLRSDQKIYVKSKNSKLIKSMRDIAKKINCQLIVLDIAETKNNRINRELFWNLVPNLIFVALTFLKNFWYAINLLRQKPFYPQFEKDGIIFFDYFFNLIQKEHNKETFSSSYWGNLNEILSAMNLKSNWVHIFIPSEQCPSPASAMVLSNRFNENQSLEFHSILEAYLSVTLCLSVLYDYITLFIKSIFYMNVERLFYDRNLEINFFHWYKSDWNNSFRGSVAIKNLFFINLFDKIFKLIPKQKLGVYLLENQPWEVALNYFWKKNNHGKLVGVAHSSIRFWDLRYHFSRQTDDRKIKYNRLLPDQYAINGNLAKTNIDKLSCIYPSILEVEALRFQHLSKNLPRENPHSSRSSEIRLLVCGDYLKTYTEQQLKLLNECVPLLKKKFIFTFKSHPSYKIDLSSYKNLSGTISDLSIEKLLPTADLLYASAMTSASLDSVACGIPTIIVLDGSSLNMSPLRGTKKATFVSSPSELQIALERPNKSNIDDSLFFLDAEFPRWKEVLKSC